MRRSSPFVRSVLIPLLACVLLWPFAAPADEGSGSPKLEEMMAAFLKASSPGPQHEFLKSQVGTWTIRNTLYIGPGDPQVSEATAEVTSILGGRFLQERYSGTMMGMPFQGIALTGYDNVRKTYIGTWMDSLSTGIVMMEGTADASGKKITWTGTATDPMTGKTMKIRMVAALSDASRSVEFYETREGKESKTMEMVYTRK